MKKILLLISVLFFCINCAEKKYFKEVNSDKNISIVKRKIVNDEFLLLNIPLKYNLNLNNSNIKDVRFYFNNNGYRLIDMEEFIIVDGETNKNIYSLNDTEFSSYPKKIYLNYFYKINKDEALELLKKYNSKATLESLKTKNDHIFLVSYNQYREDNPEFLQEMRKQPDSLFLSIGFSGGKEKTFKEKINW